jgi:enoyl-CoA hydratase/carnithine racemase
VTDLRILSPGEAFRVLGAPGGADAWDPIGGLPLFVVDLREQSWGELPSGTGRAPLLRLGCPTVAFAPGLSREGRGSERIAPFDVVADDEPALDRLARAVSASPRAATMLVQVLRAGTGSADDGLLLESLAYSTLQAGPEFAAWLTRRGPPRPRSEPAAPPVRVEREDALLRITLNRPERRNAFSAAMREALIEAVAVALADPGLDRIVLAGAGPAFCSGGDLDEFGTFANPATAHLIRTARSPARLLVQCAHRLHAELHGPCVGAGIELAAFAARVRARPDASFQLPELSMGLLPGAGGTVSIPRRIGRQRTAWLALTGERIDAPTALSWGLVDEIGPPPTA